MIKGFFYKRKYFNKRRSILNALNFGEKENQFFLVSYPKSGNTWVRVLFSNLLKEKEKDISFHNVGEYVPDTYIKGQIDLIDKSDIPFSKLPIQILKSHDPYLPYFVDKQIIYIVRDGRDAINSYYHYLNARKKNSPLISELISGSPRLPMGHWSNHVLSWQKGTCKKKIFIRYEDLLLQPEKTFKNLCDQIGFTVSEEKIKTAIQTSEFKHLKALEKKYGYYNDNRLDDKKNIAFVRKGVKGDAKNTFSDHEKLLFWKKHKKAMSIFNYK